MAQNNLIDYYYQSIYQFYREFIAKNTGNPVSEDLDFVLRFYCRGSIYMTAEWAKAGQLRIVVLTNSGIGSKLWEIGPILLPRSR